MANLGVPEIKITDDFANYKIAIIGALWNKELTDSLVKNAVEVASKYKVKHEVFYVAGSFELISAAKVAISQGFDAVAIFGVIIRGETPHFDYVSQAVSMGATELSLFGVPIGFGVLTCDDIAQAQARSGIAGSKENKGKDTMEAVLLSLETFQKIKQSKNFDS
jgi:6,7-dimethyl-8-ribityllumazine synthase